MDVCSVASVMPDSETLWTVVCQLFCPRDSLGRNIGVGCHALLQGIFPNQGSTEVSYVSCIGRQSLLLNHQGSPQMDTCYDKYVSFTYDIYIVGQSYLHRITAGKAMLHDRSRTWQWKLDWVAKLMNVKLKVSQQCNKHVRGLLVGRNLLSEWGYISHQ